MKKLFIRSDSIKRYSLPVSLYPACSALVTSRILKEREEKALLQSCSLPPVPVNYDPFRPFTSSPAPVFPVPEKEYTPAPVFPVVKMHVDYRLVLPRENGKIYPGKYYHIPGSVSSRSVLVNAGEASEHYEKQTVKTPGKWFFASNASLFGPSTFSASYEGFSFQYGNKGTDYTENDGIIEKMPRSDLDKCGMFIAKAKIRSFIRDGFTSRFQDSDLEDAAGAAKLALIESGYNDGFSGEDVPPVWEDIKEDKDTFFKALRAANNALRPRGAMTPESKYKYYLQRLTRERAKGLNDFTDAEIDEQAWKKSTVPAETINANTKGLPSPFSVRLRDRIKASINATVKRTPALAPFRDYAILSLYVGYIAKGKALKDAVKVDGRKERVLYNGIKRLLLASVASMKINGDTFQTLYSMQKKAGEMTK